MGVENKNIKREYESGIKNEKTGRPESEAKVEVTITLRNLDRLP